MNFQNIIKKSSVNEEATMRIQIMGDPYLTNYAYDFLDTFDRDDNFLSRLERLNPGDFLTLEVKREKTEARGIKGNIANIAFREDLRHFNSEGKFFCNAKDGSLVNSGEISLALVFEKDTNDPKKVNIHAELLEYPSMGDMTMPGMFGYCNNVGSEDFNDYIDNGFYGSNDNTNTEK